jgi:hypothetical protein
MNDQDLLQRWRINGCQSGSNDVDGPNYNFTNITDGNGSSHGWTIKTITTNDGSDKWTVQDPMMLMDPTTSQTHGGNGSPAMAPWTITTYKRWFGWDASSGSNDVDDPIIQTSRWKQVLWGDKRTIKTTNITTWTWINGVAVFRMMWPNNFKHHDVLKRNYERRRPDTTMVRMRDASSWIQHVDGP